MLRSVRYAIASVDRRVQVETKGGEVGQMCGPVLRRHADPRIRQVRRVGLRLLDLLGEQLLVDGAVVPVSKRHPSAGQHAVQLDDPADEVRVGLLPKGFFALAEELVQEGRDRVRERVRIEPCGTQGIPRQPAVKTQLDGSRRRGPARRAFGGCRGKNRPSLRGRARPRAARDCRLANSRAGARTGAYRPTSCRT